MVGEAHREAAVLFDGSFDGFLSVIYAVYYEKIMPLSIQVEAQAQLSLDFEPYTISTDNEKSAKVLKAIREKISEEASVSVYYAFLAAEDSRFMAILHFIRLGFKIGHMVSSHLQEDYVREVIRMERYVGREAHLLYGFCRFAETRQGAYYCPVTPKNDVLPLLANHFSQRLMNQAWVIHDKKRGQAAIYDGNSYIIAEVPKDAEVLYADGEDETQELWVTFFNTLAIETRKNKKLQRQMLPLYFRGNMTEFAKIGDRL
ncbi:MAG: TIGR03915 family putative DNA repair protein [Defluviitaleaceae bacterium]|nr:TIGR03915 family putative DNA repair protein [Defluviitaleaceae bacterium]